MEEIISMVSTVGFPIAAYFLLHFKLGKQIDKNTEALNKLADNLYK
jgi:hypothetical protein